MQTAFTRAHVGVQTLGYKYHIAGISDDVSIGKDLLALKPDHMCAVFDARRALGEPPSP